MPALNAELTLRETVQDIPAEFQGQILLVDDGSTDDTVRVARELGLHLIQHESNQGYGANQKTCYQAALDRGAQFVIMVHPDFQYDARVCKVMVELIALGNVDFLMGNRIRTRKEALDGGMPLWKYLINRVSTLVENLVLGQSISDFHSGLRAYSRNVLETIPFEANSDDFAFDQEMLVQAVAAGFKIGDIPVPVRYFDRASSINFSSSLKYGLGAINAIFSFWMVSAGLKSDARFSALKKTRESSIK